MRYQYCQFLERPQEKSINKGMTSLGDKCCILAQCIRCFSKIQFSGCTNLVHKDFFHHAIKDKLFAPISRLKIFGWINPATLLN